MMAERTWADWQVLRQRDKEWMFALEMMDEDPDAGLWISDLTLHDMQREGLVIWADEVREWQITANGRRALAKARGEDTP